MRVTPADLQALRFIQSFSENPTGELTDLISSRDAHFVKAALDIAAKLEPDLVFGVESPGEAPTTFGASWRAQIAALELWLDEIKTKPVALEALHFDALITIAREHWKEPTDGPLREFAFVKEPHLRRIVERHYTSAVNAQRYEDHLVTVVMAGSAIEAMLLDYLQRRGVDIEPHLRTPLGPLLDLAKPHLAVRTYEDARRLHDHRNRIHPGRSYRENDPEPARPDALLAMAILERLAQDLGGEAVRTE